MLEAKRAGAWKRSYDIADDGRRIAIWDRSLWNASGTFELDGRHYVVRPNMWGNKYGMVDENGRPIASADRIGRKDWTVEADGRIYEFRRASPWRHEEELHFEGRRVGSVKRNSIWSADVVADLPGLPLPVAVFVLVVVLTKWDRAAESAASSPTHG